MLHGVPCSNFGRKRSKGQVCKVADFGALDADGLEGMVGADIFGNYIYMDDKKARSQFYEKGCVESSTQILCQLCYNHQFMI